MQRFYSIGTLLWYKVPSKTDLLGTPYSPEEKPIQWLFHHLPHHHAPNPPVWAVPLPQHKQKAPPTSELLLLETVVASFWEGSRNDSLQLLNSYRSWIVALVQLKRGWWEAYRVWHEGNEWGKIIEWRKLNKESKRLEDVFNDSPGGARCVVVQIPYEHKGSQLSTSFLANRVEICIDFWRGDCLNLPWITSNWMS